MTRVRQVAPNRLFWSAGRGGGDNYLGVEVWVDHERWVHRCVFARGKYGRESAIVEESYSEEEYCEILHAEGELMVLDMERKGARALVGEALARLRVAYAVMAGGDDGDE